MNYLLLGLVLGVLIGTIPGVRETTPWGKPTAVETQDRGAWMRQRPPGALDVPPKPVGTRLGDKERIAKREEEGAGIFSECDTLRK